MLARATASGNRQGWLVALALVALLAAGAWGFSGLRLEWLARARPLPTRFDHADHRGVNCVTCHHNFRDRSLGPKGCVGCHKDWGTAEARRVDTVFHAFCTDCHARLRAAGNKAGPVKGCAACHRPRR